jgi:hypothetical protein
MFGKKFRSVVIAVGALVIAMVGQVPAHASAQINGSLSNFDTFNDSGVDAHGFEIELDGISASDVQYWFGAPYNRYGTPIITDFTNGSVSGAKVRWESPLDGNNNFVNTTVMAPANPTPTDGHACYLYGPAGATQQLYDASGCEHFGLGLINNPTNEIYNWLVDDPSNHGHLIYANTPVSIPAPVWTVSNNGNVAAALPAPAPQPIAALPGVPACALWGDAVWVKVYKTESHSPARLGALLTDSKEVPENSTEVETEWEFLQGRPTCDDTGKALAVQPNNELVHEAAAGAGSESVTRRFEIFKYTGSYDDTDGGNHEALPLCDSNPYKQICSGKASATPNADLGAYVGAQMAAANLMAAGVNTSAISVTRNGDGTGTVTDASGGITCGDLCGGDYSTGTSITLTATPDAGSHVVGWSIPGCNTKTVCTFTLTQDTTVNVAFSTTQVNTPAPTISSISTITVAAGQSITITGTDFDTLQTVSLGSQAATVTSSSSTSITVLTPCDVSSGALTVTTDGGSATSRSVTVKSAKATISSLTPTSVMPGQTLTIKGTYLACLSSVSVNSKPAEIQSTSYGQVAITVPSDATTGYVSVTSSVGTVLSKAKLTVTPLPAITSFTPSHVLPGGVVTITGVSLKGVSSAIINGTTAKTKLTGTTSVAVTVPLGASSGDITLRLPTGNIAANAVLTVDVPAPTITSVSAVTGNTGTSILVKGTNFDQNATVKIGTKSQIVNVVSPTVLVATIAQGSTTGALHVSNDGGTATWSANFTVTAGSALTTITKSSAKTGQGDQVLTITGTNLGNLASLRVAGVDAIFTILTNTTAAVVLPAGAKTGTFSGTTITGVQVTGPAITVTQGSAVPTATAVSPTSAVNGAWVKVTGVNLAGTVGVMWGAVEAQFYVTAANMIYVRVPMGVITGTMVITTTGGSVETKSIKIS